MKRILIAGLAAASLIAPARAMDPAEAGIKLVIAVGFAQKSCPNLEPNLVMLKGALDVLGVDQDDLTTPARLMQGAVVMKVFQANRANACIALKNLFGPNGSDIPGIFEVK
jgi:hypothetical protein